MKDLTIKALVGKSQTTCYLSLIAQQQQWGFAPELGMLRAVQCCQHYRIIHHKELCCCNSYGLPALKKKSILW